MNTLKQTFATIIALLSMACPAIASGAAVSTPEVFLPNGAVVVRTDENTQSLAVFTKKAKLRNAGTKIVCSAGTVVSRCADHYTLHYGEAFVSTDVNRVSIATAQAGCKLPPHCTAVIRYRPGAVFQAQVVKSNEPAAIKLKNGDFLSLSGGHQITLQVAEGTIAREPAPAASERMFDSADAPTRVFAQRGSVLSFSQRSGVKLIGGRLIVCASAPLTVRDRNASINLNADEFVSLESFNGRTRIHALNQVDGMTVKSSDGECKLDCSRELLIAEGDRYELLPCDGIGRRVKQHRKTATGKTIAISEYSMLGLLMNHPAAHALRADNDADSQRILYQLTKTCAAVEYITRDHGSYDHGATKLTRSLD